MKTLLYFTSPQPLVPSPWLIAFTTAWLAAASHAATPEERMLPPKFIKLVPLHTKLGTPEPGEWLAEHPEPGQTFRQYVRQAANRADRQRRTIYVGRLGEFAAAQASVFDAAAQYLEAFFGLPVRAAESLALSLVPDSARRKHPQWGMEQVLSTYVLNDVLVPRVPSDAVAYIAFTTVDLWPGEGWNFVFGQASLGQRVGVWSICRFGDPQQGPTQRELCLRRTLKLASHETGHMFSLMHCTYFQCNMCGSNHLEETDRRPMWLCPHCLAKLCHATGMTPEQHLRRLLEFAKKYRFPAEAEFYQRSLSALGAASP